MLLKMRGAGTVLMIVFGIWWLLHEWDGNRHLWRLQRRTLYHEPLSGRRVRF